MQGRIPENSAELQQAAQPGPGRTLPARALLTTGLLVLSVGMIGARIVLGPRMDGLLVVVLAIAAIDLAFRSRFAVEVRIPADPEQLQAQRPDQPFAAGPMQRGLHEKAKSAERIENVSPSIESQSRASMEISRTLDIFFETVADGICQVDSEGRIGFANPAAERLLSAGTATLQGDLLHDRMHGFASAERRCDEDCPLLHLAPLNQAATGEADIFRADGSSFRVEYSFTPIFDQEQFTGSVLSFRDISRRHAVERLKDEFVSTVSHELRSPLTSIRGALGLLSNGTFGEINEKAAHLLRIALTNSDRLARLINDILDLERIQCDREPIHFRPVQLAETVRQTIDAMMPVAEEAGVQVIFEATQVEIEADADRLVQVLTNLLSNAIKFSDPGSAVSVLLRTGEAGVTLSVVDRGRGIPDEMLEVIFGRFQQVEAADSRQKGGSGLGLAICRAIVLQHAGRIWAERNPDGGSTFRVFLPYRPSAAESTVELCAKENESCFTESTLL